MRVCSLLCIQRCVITLSIVIARAIKPYTVRDESRSAFSMSVAGWQGDRGPGRRTGAVCERERVSLGRVQVQVYVQCGCARMDLAGIYNFNFLSLFIILQNDAFDSPSRLRASRACGCK